MELAAFLALAVLAVVRLPALGRGGAGTLSELALLTGAGALFMVGTVVPLAVVDGWFGETNVVNLLQNVLATLAIWFMTMTAKNMANAVVAGPPVSLGTDHRDRRLHGPVLRDGPWPHETSSSASTLATVGSGCTRRSTWPMSRT